MLSYLHGFHAGNAADVLKHSVLVSCLTYLKKKEKPLLCVDTHAGAGFYDLEGTWFSRNKEWENGIGRLLREEQLPPMLASYVKSCYADASSIVPPAKRGYLGSPAIMARILEAKDRLVCFELHEREFEALKTSLSEVQTKEGPCIEVRREDGPGGLRSLLPPPSRRGLVFIDPSWEEQHEFESIPKAVREGLKRFPEGTFIIWYPLLSLTKEKAAPSSTLADTLFSLRAGKRCRAELRISAPGTGAGSENSPRGMYGSGLVIYNPPWTLRSALEETLPVLTGILGDRGGSWRVDWDAS